MTPSPTPSEGEAMRRTYLEMMRAHVDEGGQLSHRNGMDLLAEVERLRAAAQTSGVRAALQAVWDDWETAHDMSGAEDYEVKDVSPEVVLQVRTALSPDTPREGEK